MINKRSNSNYILSEIMKNANGIGESKSKNKSESDLKGANGQAISSKAHSIKTTQNLRSFSRQYVKFLEEKFETKKPFEKINNETIKEFLNEKAKEVGGGSLNTYISTAAKMSDNLSEIGVKNLDRNSILNLRNEFKNDANIDLHKNHFNRAYSDTKIEELKEHLNGTEYALAFDLQHQAGLRIDDATNSEKWQLNDDNTLTIFGSKNGLNYTTCELEKNLADRVANAIEFDYKISKTEYSEQLKLSGAEYGSHGLRYTFAQNRYQELKDEGNKTDLEAKIQTSLEMGHSRAEITEHYLFFN